MLWYEAPKEVDSTDLFTRLNVGRIPLTDAELVKALLLSRGQPAGSDRSRPGDRGALGWHRAGPEVARSLVVRDRRSRKRRRPTSASCWTHSPADPAGVSAPSSTRSRPCGGRIEEDPQAFWREVVDLHSLVLGWYEDRDLFHKVGYLIAVGRTFEELVELSKDKGRSAFEAALDEEIRAHLGSHADDVADLTYTSRKTSDVLLLMNVETIRAMQDSSERYSFRAHAAGAWSLEHIHAQNAEALNTVEQWTAWLRFHRRRARRPARPRRGAIGRASSAGSTRCCRPG